MSYYDLLFKAVRHNSALPVTAEEGMQVIRIIELAYKNKMTQWLKVTECSAD